MKGTRGLVSSLEFSYVIHDEHPRTLSPMSTYSISQKGMSFQNEDIGRTRGKRAGRLNFVESQLRPDPLARSFPLRPLSC